MMKWVWWWELERARRIHWCEENSSNLNSCLGSLGASPGSVLLVGPVPGACTLKIPHMQSQHRTWGVGSLIPRPPFNTARGKGVW